MKLLPKEDQLLGMTPQLFCHLLNISECVPIEHQDRVNRIIVAYFQFFFHAYLVYVDIMESNNSSSYSFRPCTSYK